MAAASGPQQSADTLQRSSPTGNADHSSGQQGEKYNYELRIIASLKDNSVDVDQQFRMKVIPIWLQIQTIIC